MDALDTNILARYYVDDHPEQSAIARALIDGSRQCWVPASVILELCWLLESRYALPRPRIVAVLRHLLSLDAVVIENEPTIAAAVESYAKGIDIADAIHLASSRRCTRLLSFDEKFVRRAAKLNLEPACQLPRSGN